MNTKKFTFADLLTLFSALVFGFICFLGTNFYTMGNITQSIISSVIIAIVLFLFAFGAKFLKRSNGNFPLSRAFEFIFVFLFVVAAFIIYNGTNFSHFFCVTSNKSKIEEVMQKNLENTRNMFDKYDRYAKNRVKTHEINLRTICESAGINQADYDLYGFNADIDCEEQVKAKIDVMEAKLSQSMNDEEWFASAKSTVRQWKPISVVNYINEIEENSRKWHDQLVKTSQYRAQGENADDFRHELATTNIKDYFIKHNNPTSLSTIVAIALFVLMILSYFISSRSTKSPYGYWGIMKKNKNNGNNRGKYSIDIN